MFDIDMARPLARKRVVAYAMVPWLSSIIGTKYSSMSGI